MYKCSFCGAEYSYMDIIGNEEDVKCLNCGLRAIEQSDVFSIEELQAEQERIDSELEKQGIKEVEVRDGNL